MKQEIKTKIEAKAYELFPSPEFRFPFMDGMMEVINNPAEYLEQQLVSSSHQTDSPFIRKLIDKYLSNGNPNDITVFAEYLDANDLLQSQQPLTDEDIKN